MSWNESAAAQTHPMIAVPSHDELVEQLFVRDLKLHVMQVLEPAQRKIAEQILAEADARSSNNPVGDLRDAMAPLESFKSWLGIKRESQRQLWAAVGGSVERQADQLEQLADIADPRGSVTLDPDFVVPAYIAEGDIHLMPGGNGFDDGSILQGAVMDRGGAVYMLGRNGGMLNDLRGQTAMAHLLTIAPDIAPARILDMGCGIGTSTVPAAIAFPDAEVHGIDVGASMLRYAHARAEHLGAGGAFLASECRSHPFPRRPFRRGVQLRRAARDVGSGDGEHPRREQTPAAPRRHCDPSGSAADPQFRRPLAGAFGGAGSTIQQRAQLARRADGGLWPR